MARRKLRSEAELELIYDECPDLKDLHRKVQEVEGVTIHPDGKGASIFKVYQTGHEENYQGLLRIFRHTHSGDVKAYVQWQHCAFPDACQQIWGGIVKSPDNPDGSYLKSGVSTEVFIRHIHCYADYVAAHS